MNHVLRSSTATHLALVAAGYGAIACGGAVAPSTESSAGGATAAMSSGGTADGGSAVIAAGGATVVSPGGATSIVTGGAPAVAAGGATASTGSCPSQEFRAAHLLCGVTAAGVPIAKGGACTAADPPSCFKVCGPLNLGFKTESCSNGIYVENPTCLFDAACDYSCFRVPDAPDPTCPTSAPQHGTECALPPCVVCGGSASGQTTGYLTAAGIANVGYCICRPAIVDADGFASSPSRWSCATMLTGWPCPGNPGC